MMINDVHTKTITDYMPRNFRVILKQKKGLTHVKPFI